MRSDLPTGTVTFLFTDIEGSTKLLHELGDAYAETLAGHRRVLRQAFSAHGGVEVDTQGDAFFVAFARASDAIAAAEKAQRELAAGPVRVRMGVHTGEPIATEEGYVGMDVHRAARIMSASHGGQVVLSQATRDLLDESTEVCDLGEHRLKDLSAPQRLFQLGIGEFPRLKTLHQTNLPVQPTALVGRQGELDEVLRLLRGSRLVTLTGAGGSGKTRLALHAAAELVDEFPQGVWWVSLAALRDPELVESTIGQVVGAKDGLAEHLRGWKTLLLVDNFEHVIAAAPTVAALLAEAPEVRVLATSRERLALAAEQEYAVPTLAPPEALELFATRARQLAPHFEPSNAVAEICRRLDGLPLALELAAARIKVLSPERILERLGRSLDLLTAGSRDAPERQRTLRATIDWSFELLDERERDLFARLAVFAGSFDLDAAEAVAGADLDTLAALVDKSLLRRADDHRFFMLETIREFAGERLGADSDAFRRHADYFVRLAETHSTSAFGWLSGEDLAWFESEHDNLRAALEYAAGAESEQELERRLVDACYSFWIHAGHWLEGRRRTQAVLGRIGEAAPIDRGRALRQAAGFARRQREAAEGRTRAEQALAIFRELGARGPDIYWTLDHLAACEKMLGNRDRALELFEAAAVEARAVGDDELIALSVATLGHLALDERDFARARRHFVESAELARHSDAEGLLSGALVDLAFVALVDDNVDAAVDALREGLELARGERRVDTLVWAVEAAAAIGIGRDSASEGVRLLAAIDHVRNEFGLRGDDDPIGEEVNKRMLASARESLGNAAFDTAWKEGSALTLDQAAEHAATLVD